MRDHVTQHHHSATMRGLLVFAAIAALGALFGPMLRSDALSIAGAGSAAGTAPAAVFFVSPTGSDHNSGTAPTEAFLTVARARDAVAQLKQQHGGTLPGPVEVRSAPDHWLRPPLLFPTPNPIPMPIRCGWPAASMCKPRRCSLARPTLARPQRL